MTNKELELNLRTLEAVILNGNETRPYLKLVRTAIKRVHEYSSGVPTGFLRFNYRVTPDPVFSLYPLTTSERAKGWDEVDLYTHPAKPDAHAQFRPSNLKAKS